MLKKIKYHFLEEVIICDHTFNNRENHIDRFRSFFVHCVCTVTICIYFILIDQCDRILSSMVLPDALEYTLKLFVPKSMPYTLLLMFDYLVFCLYKIIFKNYNICYHQLLYDRQTQFQVSSHPDTNYLLQKYHHGLRSISAWMIMQQYDSLCILFKCCFKNRTYNNH